MLRPICTTPILGKQLPHTPETSTCPFPNWVFTQKMSLKKNPRYQTPILWPGQIWTQRRPGTRQKWEENSDANDTYTPENLTSA